MVPLSDLRLMQVKGLPLRVLRDKIMAKLQLAERLDMLEGCGEMPSQPPSAAGFFILWVADVRDGRYCCKVFWHHRLQILRAVRSAIE